MSEERMLGLRRRGRLILILVHGTRADVWPTSGFVAGARERGARIATIDAKEERKGESGDGGVKLSRGTDWRFTGEGFFQSIFLFAMLSIFLFPATPPVIESYFLRTSCCDELVL
jgi:hypothetical protein